LDTDSRKDLALFRYQLIAPLLRLTERGMLQPALEALSRQEHKLPDGSVRSYSVRTLERYLACYRESGLDGLMREVRTDHSRPRALPQVIIDRAIALRREQPARTTEQLISILESENITLPGAVKRSTLAAHLQKAGVSRHAPAAKPKRIFQRYGATEVNEIWQCDVCDSLRVPDQESNGQMRVARLVAIIDDKSRYICQAAFYFRENLPVIEDILRKGITRHGTPAIFYCDNAKVYRSKQLAEIAARLAFELRFSKPYCPQGRGKLEKFFGYVEGSFRPEAELCIRQGKITGLEDLNRYFSAWLEQMYHQRRHGTLKKKPAEVFATHGSQRLIPPEEMNEAFLWSYDAKADKTACISVQGNTYEVEPILAGQKLVLRFDPFDLSEIQVWWEDKRYANAVPLKLRRHVDKRVAPIPEPLTPPGPPSSFLDRLVGEARHRETSGINYLGQVDKE